MVQKIPTYLEITLPNHGGDDLARVADKIRERKQPIVINLNLRSSEEAAEFIKSLKIELGIMSNKDLLPYPIYLLSEKIVKIEPFRCFKNLGEIPSFFKREQKKLNSKEASLLNNIQIIHDKLSNFSISDKFLHYDDYLKKNKLLHEKILQNRYLEDLLEGIKINE
jgi:hypothetical protein